MLRPIKRAALQILKGSRIFHLVRDSRWRQKRLLILCYHGISQEDEHVWRPALYMQPRELEQRLQILRDDGYNVLPLGPALQQLEIGELPPRSVVITFDDGTYDFYKQAYPRLRKFGFPVTVYQTTYYSDFARPIFNLTCSYMLWKRRGEVLEQGSQLGIAARMDLRSEAGRHAVVRQLLDLSEKENLNGQQKDELAGKLAALLGVDYQALAAKRILQLMTRSEVAELAAAGVDFQLHTHRHRTPLDQALFQREIRENRQSIQQSTGKPPVHFCYPSGVYKPQFLPWLAEEKVISATTCDAGLVARTDNRFLLPRLVDTSYRSAVEFESWLTGVGSWLALRREASQKYAPVE